MEKKTHNSKLMTSPTAAVTLSTIQSGVKVLDRRQHERCRVECEASVFANENGDLRGGSERRSESENGGETHCASIDRERSVKVMKER